jgi:lipopolysaccharide export system ATP-binding protein
VSILRAEGLRKSYRNRAVVDGVSIELAQGEIVALLGPNGAGKTTTFYLVTGLIRPDAGRIFLDDIDMTGEPMYRRARSGIGYLAQEPSIFRRMTVEENVLAILETLPLSKADRLARLDQMLTELDLTSLRKSPAYTLSGSRGPWPPTRSSCCSTSRLPASTRSRSMTSSRSWPRCGPAASAC